MILIRAWFKIAGAMREIQGYEETRRSSFEHLIEYFGDHKYEPVSDDNLIPLAPFGYRWFRKSPLFL